MIIDDFRIYLSDTKKMSGNTVEAYRRDVQAFLRFLETQEEGAKDLLSVTNTDIVAFLMDLKNGGKSKSTVNRKLASLRAFYGWLLRGGMILEDPTDEIHSPTISRHTIQYLSVEEIEQLLALPDQSVIGTRDRAILEFLYATGVRVSELIELKLSDINFRIGFVALKGNHGKARIVPIGRPAREALGKYIATSRKALLKDKDPEDPEGTLFVNYVGEPFSRQGFWKMLRQYAEQAGLSDRLTPQTIRNSFAMHMVANGIDIRSLQELLGHEDITATQIYFENSRGNIKTVYDRTHPRAR